MRPLQVELRQHAPFAMQVALRCEPGELLALAGPSGSGKSTLLRSIAGLHRPAEGRIACGDTRWFDSHAGLCLPVRERPVGLVFQNYALFPHLSALHNVMQAIPAHQPGRRERAADWLRRVHLHELAHRLPRELSGGQQQRVAVARALAREPAVLLLDEPFSAVDRGTREALYAELAELRQQLEIPVVLVTHDLDEAARLADRIALLSQGRIVQSGRPLQVLQQPASVEVAQLLGLKNIGRALMLRHEAHCSWLDWGGVAVKVPPAPAFAPGTPVAWCIPTDSVLLMPSDRAPTHAWDTVFEGELTRVVPASGSLQITLRSLTASPQALVMAVPSHLASRRALAPGLRLPLRLRGDAICVMPAAAPALPHGPITA
jgi:molybdate transport system ATP-binding protein